MEEIRYRVAVSDDASKPPPSQGRGSGNDGRGPITRTSSQIRSI